LVDGVERLRNRLKPDALGPDIGERGWSELTSGLDRLASVSPDPARERRWQEAMIDYLKKAK